MMTSSASCFILVLFSLLFYSKKHSWEKVIVVPTPGVLSASMSPLSEVQMALQIDRPTPFPPNSLLLADLLNGVKISFSYALKMPAPKSRTFTLRSLLLLSSGGIMTWASTKILPCLWNLTALLSKLSRTCCSLLWSSFSFMCCKSSSSKAIFSCLCSKVSSTILMVS